MNQVRAPHALFAALMLAACARQTPESARAAIEPDPAKSDAFTYANYEEVAVTHLDLDLEVRFDTKTLGGTAILSFERRTPNARSLDLDTNDLKVLSVEAGADGQFESARYDLSADHPVLGSRLSIELPQGARQVRIAYETSPGAEGLQWLDPAQTAGKRHPYLYSQNQAIFARTMAPVQDTPAVRITYAARVKTPAELVAIMSAAQDPDGARDGDYRFEMRQPVPVYLLALAVGDIDFRAINDHIGVYGETELVDAAAREFEDAPLMEEANAALYGPYRWDRYDMLVLPPSFPFGGMENPRLTFLTPTLIAGDKSLVAVVAHELAHSWSGNLVTNATWRDAWLNEGFTSYVENRVIEAIYGEERAIMERALALEDLKRDVAGASRPELTQLKLPVDLQHPDDAFSQVAYVKGQFFLTLLEQRFGRAAFDPFLRAYFERFAFQSVTTEDFLEFLNAELRAANADAVTEAELQEWVYRPGIPQSLIEPQSEAFARVLAAQAEFSAGRIEAAAIETASWSTHEWVRFINALPHDATTDQLAALDAAHGLTGRANAEIAFAWHLLAIRAGYEPAKPALESFITTIGRGKYIYRLYEALKENGRLDDAMRYFAAAKAGYHPIAQRRIADILGA